MFYELIRFNAPDPDGRRRAGVPRDSRRSCRPSACARAWPRTRRIRWRRCVFRAIREAVDRDPFAPCSVHLSESARKSSSSGPAAGRGARCSRRSASWDPAWVRARRSARCSFSTRADFSTPRVLAVHGVQMTTADLDAAGGARHDARHLSAQQRPHRRRRAADRGVLQLRRARRGRHRQPRERARPERLRRAGDDARAGADGAGVARCSTARRGRARARSASTPTTARSSRASARGCSRSTFRPASGDVEEYLVSRHSSRTRSGGWMPEISRSMFTRLRTLSRRSFASATRCSRCRSRWPARCWRRGTRRSRGRRVAWILVAMVAARSAAMGFNRLVDARIDALNPRTANRELPRGAMSAARGDASSSSSRRRSSCSRRGG